MKQGDVEGLAMVLLGGVGLLGMLWWRQRRANARIRQEKSTGRLPVRRLPPAPQARSTVSTTVVHVFVLIWVFLPIIASLLAGRLMRLLTPLAAHEYLPPVPTFSHALRLNLYWWLFWAGAACFCGLLAWIAMWMEQHFTDPAVSQAYQLMKAGRLDKAVNELRATIDAKGPSVKRWHALADALMRQERWVDALAVSLDIEDRAPLYSGNRQRKALALCKLGLAEVALAERDHARPLKDRLVEICSYCHALTDWGLFSRAWDQLRRAEMMYARNAIPESERPRLREQIDACRVRLAEHFPDKKPDCFDEL